MPGYKSSEVGVIPDDWDIVSLSAMTDPHRPISYGIVQTGPGVTNGVQCLRVLDINDGCISKTNLITTSKQISAAYQRTVLKPGDLVMPLRGKVGDVGQVDQELEGANLTRGVALIALSASWDAAFCKQIISSSATRRRLEQSMNGSALQEIPIGTLRSFSISVPTKLEEQKVIAAALNDVDALVAGLGRLIAKKHDLKHAAMQQLLTGQTRLPGFQGDWEVKRLGELGTTYGGLTGKSKADFGTGAARYVTFMNVMTNTVIDDTIFESVCVSPAENQNRVERGDLLFNGSSETPEEVALCSLVAGEVRNLFLNSFCFGFRPREDASANGLFLTYYIRSAEGREIMKSLAQGSTRYNLSKKALLAAEVRLPSLSEQVAIAGTLSDMDAELAALEARRDKTRALKQGMMQELLTGRTRLV